MQRYALPAGVDACVNLYHVRYMGSDTTGVVGMRSTNTRAAAVPNFYAAVYRLVAQIPAGKVSTYGQIARWLGHPSAARAVGYALHALAAGSDIPWQRVINAAGRVSSRCDRHYEAIQRTLLEAEGVRFDLYGSVDLQRFGWAGPVSQKSAQALAGAGSAEPARGTDAVQDTPAGGSRLLAPRRKRS
jgi:methylated-DNA-protein-cysteine methyltransferase-like protein